MEARTILMDPSQFYTGFSVKYDAKTIESVINADTTHEALLPIWAEKFKSFTAVNMCLSGGIDSQFVLSMLAKLKKDITVYIFSFVWDDCIFNAPDVLHAIRYCDRYNHSYKNIEINYKEMLGGSEFLNYCRKYKATSPQISLQLKMLDYIDNNNPTFLGGDVPMLSYDFDTQKASILSIDYQPFITYAFLNYAEQNNRIIIKEMFRMDPDCHAIAYKELLNTIKKHKIILSSTTGSGTAQPLRLLFYRDLGAEILPPLLKNTGFETLKMHLAKQTGVYNQYDVSYRFPLEQLLMNEEWYVGQYNQQFRTIIPKCLNAVKQEFEDFCRTTPDIKPIDLYNFVL
jgi:hypothetical protein